MPSERDSSGAFRSRRALLKGCAATLVTWEGLRGASAQANELRVGATAPTATLVTLDGQRIATPDLVGKVVVLTFWATWCPPCRDELPLLSRYAVQHAEAGLSVLGFSLDSPDKLADVRQVAQGLRFPVGLLAHSSAPGYGRIWRLPVNFTIDREGRLVDNGWKDKQPSWTPERLEQVVTPLLTSPLTRR
ncbi:MAG: TlpA [Gammaproteobacteria bacterium]|jgi:cytochrome c biogenesis protein CcmG/thiol:disulfide interchange protein DsbE|nr:TlpA [Gammaproteobacteria bacterium]